MIQKKSVYRRVPWSSGRAWKIPGSNSALIRGWNVFSVSHLQMGTRLCSELGRVWASKREEMGITLHMPCPLKRCDPEVYSGCPYGQSAIVLTFTFVFWKGRKGLRCSKRGSKRVFMYQNRKFQVPNEVLLKNVFIFL